MYNFTLTKSQAKAREHWANHPQRIVRRADMCVLLGGISTVQLDRLIAQGVITAPFPLNPTVKGGAVGQTLGTVLADIERIRDAYPQ